MTLNEKIVDSVSKTTGIRCFEGMPPDGIVGRFAYFFPLRSGAAKRYNEVAIFFMERPVFTPLSPEKATNDCRYLALNWLNGLYAYSGLKFQDILSQNNTRDGFGGYGVGLRLVLVDEARHTGGGATPVDKKKYFRMTADGTSAVVGWIGTYPYLEYRKEGDEWTDFTQKVTFYTWIEFRLKEGYTWSPSSDLNHFSIQTEGKTDHVILSGNIMSLVDPTLESTTIPSNYCFYCLFYRCNRIVSAVDLELPATTLRMACYTGMFFECTSLVTAPELPATTLAAYCYQSMFNGCRALTTAPELPATRLAQYCYDYMFNGCTSLTTAPNTLPATTLSAGCYNQMFYGCTSLENAPELPVTTLVTNCYNSMFIGCTSLNYIKVNFTEWLSTATDYWVENVAASGTFECPDGLSIVYDKDHIPTGWRVVKPTMYNVLAVSGDQTMGSVTGGGSYAVGDTVTLTATALDGYNFVNWTVDNVEVSTSETYTFTVSQAVTVQGNFKESAAGYLTFTALQDNSSVGWYSSTYPNLEYSTNGSTWTAFTEPVSVNTGGKVMFRNNGNTWVASSNKSHFSISSKCYLSGNIMSLVDSSMESTTIPVEQCFRCLFLNCSGITSASELELPATTLTDYCYGNMFESCSQLVDVPNILPATTLTKGCYHQMFRYCSNMTTAPVLPATSLFNQSYNNMFFNCSKLNHIEALFTTTPSNTYTSGWVQGVASSGTFVKSIDATWTDTGTNAVPTGWTVQNA